jgi:two-component system KDP operon response regulator KdpE
MPGAGARFSMVIPGAMRPLERTPDLPPRILVIEDEPNILGTLAPLLRARGYEVFTAMNGLAGLETVDREKPDLIRARPGPARHRRRGGLPADSRRASVPIVVLSARGAEGDKVARARCRRRRLCDQAVRLRGTARAVSAPPCAGRMRRPPPSEPIVRGGLDDRSRAFQVLRNGEELRLTPKEFELLTYLAQQPGRVLTHRIILKAIWGPNAVDQPSTCAC